MQFESFHLVITDYEPIYHLVQGKGMRNFWDGLYFMTAGFSISGGVFIKTVIPLELSRY